MSIFILSLAALMTSYANASLSEMDGCMKDIYKNAQWSTPSESQLECVIGDSDFLHGKKALCSSDFVSLSPEYSRYLELFTKRQKAFEDFKNAVGPGERSLANMNYMDADQAWKSYGNDKGIFSALDAISRIQFRCSQR